jgi:hypothetical protein
MAQQDDKFASFRRAATSFFQAAQKHRGKFFERIVAFVMTEEFINSGDVFNI